MRASEPANSSPLPHLPSESAAPRDSLIAHLRFRAACHPAPIYGILETALWLGVILTLTDHLSNLQHGPTGWIVWALTIGPHEMGHFICMPFGWTLNVAGGTIWQLLIFLLPALYAMFRKREITSSLIFWAMLGHSLINASVYIEDARERQLPLIFGMGPDHHDWWNLLSHYHILRYDDLLAMIVLLTGAGLILIAAGLGIYTAWMLPRARLGKVQRFEGNFFHALQRSIQ
jgi:hypothetical protein